MTTLSLMSGKSARKNTKESNNFSKANITQDREKTIVSNVVSD